MGINLGWLLKNVYFLATTPDLLNQDLWEWGIGFRTHTPGDTNDEKQSTRENVFQVVACSPTARLSTSPCQPQHPWGGQGSQPQGNPAGQADGAAGRARRDEGE